MQKSNNVINKNNLKSSTLDIKIDRRLPAVFTAKQAVNDVTKNLEKLNTEILLYKPKKLT